MIKNPTLISFLILGLIIVLAIGYATVTWREAPEMNRFTVGKIEELPPDFSKPDQVFFLPGKLEEISGLSYWNPQQLLAVQDEKGIVFVYDWQQEKVVEKWDFGKNRDYEGIARSDSTIYVLEMDGDVHYFSHQTSEKKYKSQKFESLFSHHNDTEGICFDPRSNQLLIVPKEKELNPLDQEAARHGIYALDPSNGELKEQPSYYIDEYELGKIVFGPGERYLIKPSGVAVHPISGNIYVIASVGKALVVIDRQNNVLHFELLDPGLYPQPEGITFSPNGDLFISSEGKASEPKIVRYKAPVN